MKDADRTRCRATWFYLLAGGAVLFDQLTKLIARGALGDGRKVSVIPGFFDLKLSYNTGAVFGMMPDWAPLFMVTAVVAVFAIVKLRSSGGGSTALSVGLGLLMGGALGNLIDRLTSPTRAVTDFLCFHVGKAAWPAFNIADAAIVVGVVLTFWHVYVVQKRHAEAE